MRIEHGNIEHTTQLTEDLQLHGLWAGNCQVTNGAHLELNGTVSGGLTVDRDSTAAVYGTVAGDLNAQGQVTVAGVIAGRANGPGLNVLPGAKISR